MITLDGPSQWQVPVADLVATQDRTPALRAIAEPLLRRLRTKPQVVGLGILGGLAAPGTRPFADEFSDIDISVLLTCPLPVDRTLAHADAIALARPLLPGWLPNFKFRDPASNTEFNVHQQVAECEAPSEVVWDNDKCSAYGDTLEIVYDPSGRFADLVAAKTADRDKRAFDAAVRLASRGRNLACQGVTAGLGRGRADAIHEILAQVTGDAIDVMLFLSGIWPPAAKWRLVAAQHLLDHRRWLPGWDYRRLLALRQPASDNGDEFVRCRALQAELLALLVALEDRSAAAFPHWPSDVYTFAMTRLLTDKQLLTATAADTLTQARDSYATRLADTEWNHLNLFLHDLEPSSEHREPRLAS